MIKRITIAIVISFIIVLSLYFIMFHGGLSDKASSWSEFGGYISGVLMPILTTINIYVFLKLTNAISEKDIAQSEKEMENQKQMVLMQFRKNEIDTLLETLNNAIALKVKSNTIEVVEPMLRTLNYLETFTTTKLSLFDLDENSETVNDIITLSQAIRQIYVQISENRNIDKESVITVLKLKSKVITALQEITLSMK